MAATHASTWVAILPTLSKPRGQCAQCHAGLADRGRRIAHPSVTGRSGSRGQPSISDVLLAGHSLLYGVGAAPSRARPPPDGVRKGQVDQSTRVVVISHKGVHGLTWSSSLGEGTSLREGWC